MIEDLVDRVRLLRTAGIGPVTFRQLIMRFGTPAKALAAVPDLARRGGGRVPAVRSTSDAEREISRVERLGARYLALGQGLYPRLLAELEDAPPLLVAKGNLNLLDQQAVAIVGARNASAAARRFARGLAHDLGWHDPSSFRGSRDASTVQRTTVRSQPAPSAHRWRDRCLLSA